MNDRAYLENARKLLRISDERVTRLSGKVNELEDGNHHLGEENYILTGRVAELEAALTDALYAWGLVGESNNPSAAEHLEAQERIQRARLALPKESEAK